MKVSQTTLLHPYLTPKQSQFFESLKQAYGRQPLPSMDTIAKAFGFQHKNSVWQYFKVFKVLGFILEENRRVFINPIHFGAALIDTPVRAGLPSSTEGQMERRISLDETFELDHPDTVLFKVSGDSMTGLGIFEHDWVIIRKTPHAQAGEVVLAQVDQEFTLKTLRYHPMTSQPYLEAANADYAPIYPKESLSIFGRYIGLVRRS